MTGYVIVNEEIKKTAEELDSNTDNSFGIKSVINFIIDKHKQLLLLLLAFVIIYVVDHITYYNNLFYSMPSIIPGVSQQQPQPNSLKKKSKKSKK
jgi:hypothetical protein